MTDLDLDALEATARAATPGPWQYQTESPSMGGENYTIRRAGVPGIRMTGYVYGFGTGMIEHVTTFDPPTALALIAEVRRLREAERQRDVAEKQVEIRSTDSIAARIARSNARAVEEWAATQALLREQARYIEELERFDQAGLTAKLREAEEVIEKVEALLPKWRESRAHNAEAFTAGGIGMMREIDYHGDVERTLATYKLTNQEEEQT